MEFVMTNIIIKNRQGRYQDITGFRYGSLTIIKCLGSDKNRAKIWLCFCDCGNETISTGKALRSGKKLSCGCLKRDAINKAHITHGMTKSNEYAIWKGILARTLNPNNKSYIHYGGRGITVCEQWKKFENFYSDMGKKPSPSHSIDRIDVNGNYEPSNCRWVRPIEQQNNRRNNCNVFCFGETKTKAQWAKHVGIDRTTIDSRIRMGWTIEQALTKTPRKLKNGK